MYNDYHVHTSFSCDGKASPEAQLERAVELGIKRICFTDHEDIGFPPKHGYVFSVDTEEYFSKLGDLKREYADRIELNIGIEIGLQVAYFDEINAFALSKLFDFIIGSTHLVDCEDPCLSDYFDRQSEDEAIVTYLKEVLRNVKTFDNFDVVGHIDYIVRYTKSKGEKYDPHRYFDIIDEILKTAISKGKGIECNTSRIGNGYLHCNPHEDIIKRYKELGGEIITLGSDSHLPKTLGHGFEKAGAILKNAGFKYYTVFENRKPEFLRLD